MDMLFSGLAEVILSVLIASIAHRPEIAKYLEKLQGESPEKQGLEKALQKTYATFSKKYPDLVNALFDQHFLRKTEVAIELAKVLTPNRVPYKPALEKTWRAQFANELKVDLFQPLTFFLDTFSEEVKAQPALKPFVDTQLLHSIDEHSRQIQEILSEVRDIFRVLGEASITLSQNIRLLEFENLVRERTKIFIGREFVFTAIENQIQNLNFPSGYIVISGEPGIGKTALAAMLVKRFEAVHHFNIAAQNIRSARTFLRNVCAQLIVRYSLPYRALPPDISQDGGFLSKLLAEVTKQTFVLPLVILIDALDEAEDMGLSADANRLYLPPNLPDGVFFIVTTRAEHDYRLVVDHRKDIYLVDHDTSNLSDIKLYIHSYLQTHESQMTPRINQWSISETEFVKIVTDKSEGNFMYLVHVMRDIREGRLSADLLDDIQKLPRGLKAYYQRHWRIMRDQAPERFERYYEPVVCTLAVVKEPVTITQLAEWTSIERLRIKEVLSEWGEFLNIQVINKQDSYQIYHSSFQDFLRQEVGLAPYHDLIINTALGKIR